MGCRFAGIKSHLLPGKHVSDYSGHGVGDKTPHNMHVCTHTDTHTPLLLNYFLNALNTYSHNRTPFSREARKSFVSKFFSVTARNSCTQLHLSRPRTSPAMELCPASRPHLLPLRPSSAPLLIPQVRRLQPQEGKQLAQDLTKNLLLLLRLEPKPSSFSLAEFPQSYVSPSLC